MEQEQNNNTDTTQNQPKGTNNQGSSTQVVLAYGSSESHQFPADKEKHAIKPISLTNLFSSLDRHIFSVACGRLHTVVLTTNGEVYTFGSNHDGALGRKGDAKKPGKVELDFPVDMISAGDSHSVACNSNNFAVYHWGTYHGANNTKISHFDTPQRIGENEFKKKKVQKVVSGANHTLALVDGKVYAWGDPETGILGRVMHSRRKADTPELKVELMGVKGAVEDIFTGANHAFLKKTEKRKKETFTVILAWGLNDCAQLGLGNTENSHLPVEVTELRDINVKNITGGEHHTVVLTEEGDVYTFGKNDDGQLGLGKDFEEKEEEVPEEEEKPAENKTPTAKTPAKNTKKGGKGKSAKKTEEKKDESAEQAEGEGEKEKENGEEKKPEEEQTQSTQENKEKTATATKSKAKGKGRGTDKKETEEDVKPPAALKIIKKPTKVELSNVEKIFSGNDFNYAVTKDALYSWGLGNKYVLGNGKEETVYTPEKLDKDLFQGKKVSQISLGASHVIVLANDEGKELELDEEVTKKVDEKLARKNTTGKKGAAAAGTTGKKGKGKKDEEEAGADDVKKDLSKSLEEKDEKEEKIEEEHEEEEEEGLQKGKKKSLKRKATGEESAEPAETKKVKKSQDKSPEKEGKKSAGKSEKKSVEKEAPKEQEMEEEKEEDKGEAKKDETKAAEAPEAMKDEKEDEKEAPKEEATTMQEEESEKKEEEKKAEPVQEEKPAETEEKGEEKTVENAAAPAAEGENKEAVANA